MAREMTRRFADTCPKIDIREQIRMLRREAFAGVSITLRVPTGLQTVALSRVPRPRFGGERIYYECPWCHRRADILYWASGRIACRQCQRLHYWVESINPVQRRVQRLLRIRERMGQPPGRGVVCDFPNKPKWMRRHTYEQIRAAAQITEARHWQASNAKISGRIAALFLAAIH